MIKETKRKLIKTVFDWDLMYIYISGPIDYAYDRGAGWRQNLIPKLEKIGIPRNHIINPLDKPIQGAPFDLNDEGEIIDKYRITEEYNKLVDIMGEIVHIDSRFVDISSIIIAYFPKENINKIAHITDKFEEIYRVSSENSSTEQMRDVFYELVEFYTNMRVPTYFTLGELSLAKYQRKPIFVVWEGDKKTCSGYVMWLAGANNVFNKFDDLVQRLDDIRNGREALNADDWLLLNLDKNK